MDRIKERLATLRAEADAANDRAEAAEAKNKKLEQELLAKEQEITSLQHKLGLSDGQLEAAEAKLADVRNASAEGESSRTTAENLTRKVQLLEEELDAAEKNVKETVEKLRQVDVKAEHFERQEMKAKHDKSKAELEELERSMGDI
ncbi:hypothetical protein FRC07_005844 [Ceratobasidium sp. 392]|nr:hypothetical protein FRC07_005844 [Ceratobasidium sp. 392]